MSTSTINFSVGPNLGTYRASNNYFIPLSISDSTPSLGTITFSLTTGTLPPSLQLDSVTGYIYGYLEYENDYLNTQNFSVTATKTFIDASTTSTSSNFSITVKGFIDTNVEWSTTSSLGIIKLGYDSTLKVIAMDRSQQLPQLLMRCLIE